jgi:endo-1,4-beta-mannosidase
LLVEETAAAAYTAMALAGLRRAGCLGAMLWCYSDYDLALWEGPPLDHAMHERSFGLWRADGSPKPAVAAVAAFVADRRDTVTDDDSWIDLDRDEFYLDPSAQLPRLYRRYRGA